MGANGNYQQFDTKPSSSGAKLYTAYPRAEMWIAGTTGTGSGLVPIGVVVPPAVLAGVGPGGAFFPIRDNLVYRFKANLQLFPADPTRASLESAQMQLLALPALAGGPNPIKVNAARLSALTALASNIGISYDEWEIDCNDLIAAAAPLNLATALTGRLHSFQLTIQAVVNVTGGGMAIAYEGSVTVDVAQFNSYRFSKWE